MILRTKDLSIGYGRREVLGGIDVGLSAGQLACLVGPNGAGKSTLLRTLAGLQPRLGGGVLLGGRDLRELDRVEVARQLAVVLTDRIDPGRLSAEELVGLGRHPHTSWTGKVSVRDREVVTSALRDVGAEHVAGLPIAELSDGQRQRIMVARALAQEPRVLLLDEPTAFLDPPGRLTVFELLRKLAADRQLAVLVCTHDVELAVRHAESVWALAPTGIVAGAPEDLIADGTLAIPFETAGVGFDIETLTFQREVAPVGQAIVLGDGASAVLARHCLRRAGYEVGQEPHSGAVLVEATAGVWRVGEHEFNSLGELYLHVSHRRR